MSVENVELEQVDGVTEAYKDDDGADGADCCLLNGRRQDKRTIGVSFILFPVCPSHHQINHLTSTLKKMEMQKMPKTKGISQS